MDKVSIIIPVYNRENLIVETLESVLMQEHRNWECIIVDDGSSDETEKIVHFFTTKDQRFTYHQRPVGSNKGANTCRNYGYYQSSGDYIKWLDSDDVLLADALKNQVEFFSHGADVVVSKLAFTDFASQRKIKENNIISDNLIEDYFSGKVAFYVSGPLWNRDFLNRQNILFDESITNLDDWDFNLRMLYQNPKIIFNENVIIKYRIHEDSLSNEIQKLNIGELQSEFYAREKHLRLIEENKSASVKRIRSYIKSRYQLILRELLVRKHSRKYYFLYKLLGYQIGLFDFKGILKTLFGFTFYHISGKGYKYLK